MKKVFILFLIFGLYAGTGAQNWAPVPCSAMNGIASADRMFVDSLHNEIILVSVNGSTICNTKFKGIVAYNGNGYDNLDKGFNLYDQNAQTGSLLGLDCITYGNQTLFGGYFFSVGSDTLYTKSTALWNGARWDSFPTHCFSNKPTNSSGGAIWGFIKHQNKLWMYGGFDTIGNTVTKNLVAYDGTIFTAVPRIPTNNPGAFTKAIAYKNKIIAGGGFYNYNANSPQPFTFFRLAQFDGTSWAEMDHGIQGSIAFVYDMAIYQDTLYISGAWNKADGNAGNYIVKWDGNHLYDAGFGSFCGYGNVRSLVPYRNRLYAFGNFPCAANQKAFGQAYYENGAWTVPLTDSIANYSIGNGVVYNDEIYLCGGFESINGDTSFHLLARLLCPDFDASTGCVSAIKTYKNDLDVKVFPNPSNESVQLQFDQSIVIDRVSISNTLGQRVYGLIKPAPNQQIDISQLPAGLYFLKAESKQAQKTFKLLKE